MHHNRKADRNARIGQDVKDATKKKVDFKNDQAKELQKLQKIDDEAKKAQKQTESLQTLVKKQKDDRKAIEKTVKDCEKIAKWVEKILKQAPKELEKTVASEVKVFQSTSKSLEGADGLATFLMACVALLITIRQSCAKQKSK